MFSSIRCNYQTAPAAPDLSLLDHSATFCVTRRKTKMYVSEWETGCEYVHTCMRLFPGEQQSPASIKTWGQVTSCCTDSFWPSLRLCIVCSLFFLLNAYLLIISFVVNAVSWEWIIFKFLDEKQSKTKIYYSWQKMTPNITVPIEEAGTRKCC